ncbi:MAG: 50S ribosomal protein L29 [Gemmatimonadetes bacterium]|nr:50S ribosomal protein L29 [Gemmatimonadota bacterium]
MALTKLKMTAIREMTDIEIRAKLAELEKERFGLRFKTATEVMANPMDLRTTRRTVAQLKTVLAERAAKAKAKAT